MYIFYLSSPREQDRDEPEVLTAILNELILQLQHKHTEHVTQRYDTVRATS